MPEDFVTISLDDDDQGDMVTLDISDTPKLSRDQQDVEIIRSQPERYNETSPDIDPYKNKTILPEAKDLAEADRWGMERYSLDGTEVRRARPNLLSGETGKTLIALSPDGQTIGNRQNLIEQEKMGAAKIIGNDRRNLRDPAKAKAYNEAIGRIKQLEADQETHRTGYTAWLDSLVSDKPGQFIGEDSAIHDIKSRDQKAISAVASGARAVDELMSNGAFKSWAKRSKGLDITLDSFKDQKARDAAEEFLMSSPSTSEYVKDLFPRMWNGFTSIGPGASGSIGIALKAAGFDGIGQWFEDLAAGADLAGEQRQDPRKVGAAAEFGQNVATGLGTVGSSIVPGLAVARGAKLMGAGAKATNFLSKGTVLGSSGAMAAWDQYKDAKQHGASDEDATIAAGLAAITQAPLELVSPVPKWINKIGDGLKQPVKKALYEALIDGAQEASTETAQQFSSNAIAQRIYDRDRKLWEGAEQSAGVGGVTGSIFSLILNSVMRGKTRNMNLTPEERKKNESLANIEQKKEALMADTQSNDVAKLMALSRRQDEIKAEMASNQKRIDEDVEGKTTSLQKQRNEELQKELDSISEQIGSFEEFGDVNDEEKSVIVTPEQEKKDVDELAELDKEFEAADENDTETLEDINRRRFEVMDRQARAKVKETIDPQSEEPVTTKGERSRAQTVANIQGVGVPFNRPNAAQIRETQKTVNKTIGAMFVGGQQQKRAASIKAEIKKAVNENIQFLAGTGAQVISADDYNEQHGKKHQVDPETYTALIGGDGQLFLILPSVGQMLVRSTEAETRAASKEASADQLRRTAPKHIEEEIIHLAMLHSLKESNRSRGGSANTDLEYAKSRLKSIAAEIRKTNPNAVPDLADVYLKDRNKKVNDYTLATEMVRMVLQRLRTGQLSEDVEKIRRAEQAVFTDSDRSVIESLRKAITEALVAIRDTISRYLSPETSTPEMKKILKETESILDRFGVVAGKENNVTPKDYSDAAPKTTQPKQAKEAQAQTQEEGETTSENKQAPTSVPVGENIVNDKALKEDQKSMQEANSPLAFQAKVESTVPVEVQRKEVKEKGLRVFANRAEVGIHRPKRDIPRPLYRNGPSGVYSEFTGKDQRLTAGRGTGVATGTYAYQTLEAFQKDTRGEPDIIASGSNPAVVSFNEKDDKLFGENVSLRGTNKAYMFGATARNLLALAEGVNPPSSIYHRFKGGKFPSTYSEIATALSAMLKQYGTDGVTLMPIDIEGYNVEYAVNLWREIKSDRKVHPINILLSRKGHGGILYGDDVPQGNNGEYGAVVFPPIDKEGNLIGTEEINSVYSVSNYDEHFNEHVEKKVNELKEARKLLGKDAPIANDSEPLASQAKKEAQKTAKPVPRSVQIREKLSNKAVDDMVSAAEFLSPKKDKSGKEKISKVTKEGETFPFPLVSPWADPSDITYLTTNSSAELRKAADKLQNMKGGFDMFRASHDIANGITHGLTIPEQFTFLGYANSTLYLWKDEFLNSSASEADKNQFLADYIETSGAIENSLKSIASTSGLILQFSKMLRSLGSPGGVAKQARDAIRGSASAIAEIIGINFHEVASELRGARNKSLETVWEEGSVVAAIKNAFKKARQDPERLARDIRKNFSKKKTLEAREIVLKFAASIFQSGGKQANQMIVDQTVKALMTASNGSAKPMTKESVEKSINRAIAEVARDLKREKEGEQTSRSIEGSTDKLKAVLGNDKTRISFVNALEKEISKNYKNKDAFNDEFSGIFEKMKTEGWSESLRNQSIKEVAGLLNYKFEDLFGYLGETRNVKTQEVKDHFRKILSGIASNEKIDQFIADVDKYLTDRTAEKLEDALSLTITDKLKPFHNQKIKEISTQELFKKVKGISDVAKMSISQTKSFKEAFIERVIDEIGLPEKESADLAQVLEESLSRAILAQKNAMLDSAIKRATTALGAKGIKANKKGLEQTLIEMAFSGVISNMDVYEAFRQTHNFPKEFMPYNHQLENELMAWGEKAMSLPEGDARAREQQKMMQYFASQAPVHFIRDVLPSWWFMSLLSGVGTYAITNPISSVWSIMGNVSVWSILNPKQSGAMLKGMWDMVMDKDSVARHNFSYVMETGLNPSGVELRYPKLDVVENAESAKTNNPLSKFMLRVIRGVKIGKRGVGFGNEISPRAMLRSLRAADAYFRAIAEEVVRRRMGYEPDPDAFEAAKLQAESEYQGAKGDSVRREIMMRAAEIYNNQRVANKKDRGIIEEDARQSVFTQDPQGFLGMLSRQLAALTENSKVKGFPVISIIIPFTNVVANVWNSSMNYTPWGAVRALHGTMKAGGNSFTQGRNDKALELGMKSLIGTILILAAASKAEEEDKTKGWDIYGSGPLDPEENKVWREAGGKPYTIRIGTKYFPYNATPFTIALASAAEFREYLKKSEKKKDKLTEPQKLARMAFTVAVSAGTATMDQGFLTGLSDAIDKLNSNDPVKGAQQLVAGIGSRFVVPGFVRDLNALNPMNEGKKYQADNMVAAMFMEMPIINAAIGDTALNLFGDEIKLKPIQAGPITIPNRISSRLVSEQNSSLAMQVLLKNSLEVGDWNKTARWSERPMTYEEKRAYVQAAGPQLKEFLETNSEDIAELPREEAQELLNNVLTDIRAGAKSVVAEQFNVDFTGETQ